LFVSVCLFVVCLVFLFVCLFVHSKHPQIERGKNISVLVAEDNATNQLVLKRLLSQIGVKFEIVKDGKEAVELFTQRPRAFDLIFMDLQVCLCDFFFVFFFVGICE
jgi:PleD family two-component response regulator